MSASSALVANSFDHVPRRINVAEFGRMIDAGVFADGERIELVDGVLMSYAPPQGQSHCGIIWGFFEVIRSALGDRAAVRAQSPVIISEETRLEPDLAVLRPPAAAYRRTLPGAHDVLAVVEVADSSLRFDRGRKRALYASAGIPEYWVVDVQAERLEVYRELKDDGYEVKFMPDPDGTIAFAAFPDTVLSVRELFA